MYVLKIKLIYERFCGDYETSIGVVHIIFYKFKFPSISLMRISPSFSVQHPVNVRVKCN